MELMPLRLAVRANPMSVARLTSVSELVVGEGRGANTTRPNVVCQRSPALSGVATNRVEVVIPAVGNMESQTNLIGHQSG